jgi:hypothetical protein
VTAGEPLEARDGVDIGAQNPGEHRVTNSLRSITKKKQ